MADATNPPEPSGGAAAPEPLTPPVISPDVAARIDQIAEDFVRAATGDRFDPARERAIAEMSQLGASDLLAGSMVEQRLLDRRDARFQVEIAANLTRLRDGVEDLRHGIGEERPDARRAARTERRLNDVLAALGDGGRALEQDTAVLLQEQHVLWTQVETLERYAAMAQRMEERLVARMAELAEAEAHLVRDDVLLPLRVRRADLATQLAVGLQACAALRIVEQNNRDLIGAIRTATGTTMAALRTSQLVAEALRRRAESGGTAAAPGGTAAAGVAAGVGAAALQDAWDDVFAALQRVEEVKRHVATDWTPVAPNLGGGA